MAQCPARERGHGSSSRRWPRCYFESGSLEGHGWRAGEGGIRQSRGENAKEAGGGGVLRGSGTGLVVVSGVTLRWQKLRVRETHPERLLLRTSMYGCRACTVLPPPSHTHTHTCTTASAPSKPRLEQKACNALFCSCFGAAASSQAPPPPHPLPLPCFHRE